MLAGGIGVVAFDAVAAWAAKTFEFEYAAAAWGSFLIYAAVGYAASRETGSLRVSAAMGGAVALVEATVGLAVAWAIGPGRLDGADAPLIAATIAAVVLVGALIGCFGGWVQRRFTSAPT